MYESVESFPVGLYQRCIFEFGDLFEYYKYDAEEKVYLSNPEINNEKILTDIKSYYSIKVNKFDRNIEKASDSLFNCVDGNSNYNITGDYSDEIYFVGRTLISCSLSDFELIETEQAGHCYLSLNQDFIDYYSAYGDKIVLSINIDLDYCAEIGVVIDGFAENAFGNFEVYQSNIALEVVDNVVVN